MASPLGKQIAFSLWAVLAMLSMPYVGVISPVEEGLLEEEIEIQEVIAEATGFNVSDGFTPSNITVASTTGQPVLDRPVIGMQTIPAPAMMFRRAAGCLAYNDAIDEAWLIGGRYDPNPSQSGDEDTTNFIETLAMNNKTWFPSPDTLPQAQAYHECVELQGKIYSIGDYHPFATPAVRGDGIVHIFDPTTNNWTTGTSMPSTTGVGLAGMDAHGGFIYVAGGVGQKDRSDLTNRTMRYNPATDVWDYMANMSAPRHSFELVTYHDKLYAIGGFVRLFDAALNQTTTAPANHTEIYDPLTNTWINGSDLPFKIAAHSALVHNDEILIAGGMTNTVRYDQIRGYNPLTGEIHAHGTLHTPMYDFDMLNVNGSLVYAGGDTSNYRFSTWSTSYSDTSASYDNPTAQAGTLLSNIFDLRTGLEGSATPLWVNFDGVTPASTNLTLQYKTGPTLSDTSSSSWRPLGPNQSAQYLEIGNHTLTDAMPGDAFVQYQISFGTTELNQWSTPSLNSITVASEEARFHTPPPPVMNPNAALSLIQTFHSASSTNKTYAMHVLPTTYDGFSIIGLDAATLTYQPATSTLSISDPDSILRSAEITATHASNMEGDTVDWSIAINDGLSTPYLRLGVATEGLRSTHYNTSSITTIDSQLKVEVLGLSSAFSSQGGQSVEAGETYPGDAPMTAIVDHSFTNSAARLQNGLIEARLNVDVQATEELGSAFYTNPGAWTTLTTGATTAIDFQLPNGTSGEGRIWLEARTSDDLELEVDAYNQTVVINIQSPVLTSTTPSTGAYSNELTQRMVTLDYHDVGGFSNATVQGFIWVEALDDNSGNGVAEANEYRQHPLTFSNIGNAWTIALEVNESANVDHQLVRIWLKGTDMAGYSIGEASSQNGTTWWESRTASKGQLLHLETIDGDPNDPMVRLEPTKSFAWRVEVTDTNKLSDITRVNLLMGNDPTLGLRYNANLDTCEALDARIQVTQACSATVAETIIIEFHAVVDWTFVTPGTNDGRIEIRIDDYDGSNSTLFEGMWSLEQEMSVVLESLMDIEGASQGALVEGWSIISGETIRLNASMSHLLSNTSYTGPVSVYWNGKLQSDRWSGGTSGEAIDGHLSIEFAAPLGAGLLFDMELTVWDPYASQELLSVELPTLRIDGAAPVLLDSTLSTGLSRFHLSEIEIGANIEEANLWSSNLTLTCQIRSLDESWPELTLSRASSTVYDGKTMFSFTFDFSDLGDPSLLSTQANVACWADGFDDAGWALVASTGNSQLDPWLVLPLSSVGPDVAISGVEVSGSKEAGATMRLGIQLVSVGESIDEPFNISIFTELDGERILVGRELVPRIGMNTATTLRSSITVPSGSWTLHVEADAEQAMWEVDETNNAWNATYAPIQTSFGSATLLAASGAGVAIIAFAVLLLRRRNEDTIQADSEAVEPTSVEPAAQPSRGPPPRKTESKPKPAGLKGPPERKPQPDKEPTSDIAGAAALDALLPVAVPGTGQVTIGSVVNEWSQLPPGGDYEYGLDETIYKGDECGTWRMNEDKTFIKIE